jgi:hypothetical protein
MPLILIALPKIGEGNNKLPSSVDNPRERPYLARSRARSSVVEQLAFNQLVAGSTPAGLTRICRQSPSSRGLGQRPFTAPTRVRIPSGTPPGTARCAGSMKATVKGGSLLC